MFHVEHQRRFFFKALRSTVPGSKADLARCQLKNWLKRLYSGSPHSVPIRLAIRSFALLLPSWLPVPFTRSLWMRSASPDFGSPAFHFRTMQREVSKIAILASRISSSICPRTLALVNTQVSFPLCFWISIPCVWPYQRFAFQYPMKRCFHSRRSIGQNIREGTA